MSQKAIRLSLAYRMTVFFARNPDEELTSADVVTKFGVESTSIHRSLSASVETGLLERVSSGAGRGRLAIYSAGDELLKEIGEKTRLVIANACTPVHFEHSGPGALTA